MINIIKKELKQGETFLKFSALKIIAQMLMFLVPLLIAKYFSPEEFGIYSLGIMVVYFLTAILINSSQKAFIVYANQELKENNKINKAFTIRLIFLSASIIIFSALSLLFLNQLMQFTSMGKVQFLFLFLAYIGLGIRYSFESIFLALNKRIINAFYGMFVGVISIIYVLIAHYFFTLNLESIFLMFLIAPILAIPFVIKYIDMQKLFPLVFDKDLFKRMFDFTKWMIIGGAAIYFISWGDNLVLRYFVSLEEIGFYNLGYQIFKGMTILVGITGIYFLPFITQNLNKPSKIHNYLYKKRPRIFIMGIVGIAILYLFIPIFFSVLYGSTYDASINIVQILLIASVFILYQSFYVPIFDAMKRYRFTQITNILFVIINLLLDIFFVSIFGMVGAAIATVITYVGMSIVYEIYFRKNCKNNII